MTINVFDRLKDGAINVDGRDGSLDSGADGYSIVLTIAPATVEPGALFDVTVRARKNGDPIADQTIGINTTSSTPGDPPASVQTDAAGDARFAIIADAVGTATLTATMVIDGVTYTSNSVQITVSSITPPVDADATGHGRVLLNIENPLAGALLPKPQRLSDQEQRRKHPGDTGLSRVGSYENLKVTFIPSFLQ